MEPRTIHQVRGREITSYELCTVSASVASTMDGRSPYPSAPSIGVPFGRPRGGAFVAALRLESSSRLL